MSTHDPEPSDIYVDADGKLWRCVTICQEPTVTFEEVEGHFPLPPNLTGAAQAGVMSGNWPPQPQLIKARKSGGVGGHMWLNWRRIYRPT